MMEITNPVVANSLIDQREVECALLISTSEEACRVMDGSQPMLQNGKRAITKNADLFFPYPDYRTYGGHVSRPRFLQVSTSEAIQWVVNQVIIFKLLK